MAMVEYALLAGLIAVVALVAANQFQSAGKARLTAKASTAGSPDLSDPAGTPSTASTTTLPPEPGAPVAPASVTPTVSPFTFSTSGNKSHWAATVDVSLTDPANGSPVQGATITATWSVDQTPATCVTQKSGSCSLTETKMDTDGVPSVTFTVTNVSGTGLTAPGTYPAPLQISRPA